MSLRAVSGFWVHYDPPTLFAIGAVPADLVGVKSTVPIALPSSIMELHQVFEFYGHWSLSHR